MQHIEKHYAEQYEQTGYFAAVNKGTLFDFVVNGKEEGCFVLWEVWMGIQKHTKSTLYERAFCYGIYAEELLAILFFRQAEKIIGGHTEKAA